MAIKSIWYDKIGAINLRFNEIIGNDDKKEYLNNIVKSQKISNSYIFAGNSGIGKMLFAKEFARKILCLENGDDNCTCVSCSMISNGNPDLITLDKQEDEEFIVRKEESFKEYEKINGIKTKKSSKSKKEDSETEKKKKKIISVDEVRNLISKLIEKPVCSQRKVCIINDKVIMFSNIIHDIMSLISNVVIHRNDISRKSIFIQNVHNRFLVTITFSKEQESDFGIIL